MADYFTLEVANRSKFELTSDVKGLCGENGPPKRLEMVSICSANLIVVLELIFAPQSLFPSLTLANFFQKLRFFKRSIDRHNLIRESIGSMTNEEPNPTESKIYDHCENLLVTANHKQTKPAIVLLSSTVLMLVWKHFGSADFYNQHLANHVSVGDAQSMSAIFQFVSSLVWLGLIPAAIIKCVFREKLSDYGLQVGDRKLTLRFLIVGTPIFLVGAMLASRDPILQDFFPINKQAGAATPFALHALTYALFYLGWEFHFRGFVQFGLTDSMGRANAILVQTMASALLHIGQPTTETFAAIGGGLIWGWFAARSKSILSGLVQHMVLGIALDAILVYS